MKIISVAAVMCLILAGCNPAPKPAPASESGAGAAIAPVASFTIGTIDQDETDITGCTTMLSRTDSSHFAFVFLDGPGDSNPHGFMKIDGAVIRVDQTSQSHDEEKGTLRELFASTDGKLSVVEDLVIGEAHAEADSVDLSGSLTVTYKGMIQTVPVKGGTAC